MIWTQRRKRQRDDGFTLVELMVVFLIIGVLAGIAIASYNALTDRAAEAACLSNQRTLIGAVQYYRNDHGGLAPSSIDDLEGYANTWNVISKCPLGDGTLLYYDAVADTIVCPNHPFP